MYRERREAPAADSEASEAGPISLLQRQDESRDHEASPRPEAVSNRSPRLSGARFHREMVRKHVSLERNRLLGRVDDHRQSAIRVACVSMVGDLQRRRSEVNVIGMVGVDEAVRFHPGRAPVDRNTARGEHLLPHPTPHPLRAGPVPRLTAREHASISRPRDNAAPRPPSALHRPPRQRQRRERRPAPAHESTCTARNAVPGQTSNDHCMSRWRTRWVASQ